MRAVILAGGSGTRLWPLSRSQMPKQFLPLVGEGSLFQDTVERVRPLVGDDVCVVTTEETRFLVAAQLETLGIDPVGKVISEPAGRNTRRAGAVAASGLLVTFGIAPSAPETGYGYIRLGAPLTEHQGFRAVDRFVEKPDLVTAAAYLDELARSYRVMFNPLTKRFNLPKAWPNSGIAA